MLALGKRNSMSIRLIKCIQIPTGDDSLLLLLLLLLKHTSQKKLALAHTHSIGKRIDVALNKLHKNSQNICIYLRLYSAIKRRNDDPAIFSDLLENENATKKKTNEIRLFVAPKHTNFFCCSLPKTIVEIATQKLQSQSDFS